MRGLLCLFLALGIALPATAQEKAPKVEWDALYAVYNQRAELVKHRESAKLSAELAARYPDDKRLQIFCAQTAYYCAHRLLDKEDQKKATAETGLKCAERLLEKNDKDYDGRFWASMTSFKAKSADGIRAALKEASKIKKFLEQMKKDEPKRPEAYMMLGTLYRELPKLITWGDPDKGLELLKKADELSPLDPEILLELAAAYAKVGQKEKAKETYKKCINDSKAPKDRKWETRDAQDYAKKMLKELED
jgi:tetratricopeptide (TPR) repeat protein